MEFSPEYSLVEAGRRVQAQWGNDGDFITPEGKVIHAGENHTIFMMDNPEMFGDNREPDDMIAQGWIRTRTMFGTFSADASGGMNENQLHAFQKMARERCGYSDPRIEVLMDDGDVYELTCDELDYIEYPNQIKRGLRSASRRVAIDKYTYNDAMEKFHNDLPFDNLFGPGVNRIVIPFENDTKQNLSKALGKSGPLGEKGYDRIDWQTGEAVKVVPPHPSAPEGTKPKEQRVKLGKAIGRLPNGAEMLDWWSRNQEFAKDDKYSMVISRHPVDVVRMSDHADIESCHSPDASHWSSCLGEMSHGGLVAYMVNTEDLKEVAPEDLAGENEIFYDGERDIEGIEPLSRLRIRRFTHEDGDFDLAIPEQRVYGSQNSEFPDQIGNWARNAQESVVDGKRWRMKDFIRRGGSYADNDDSALFNIFFQDNLDRGNTKFGIEGEEDEGDNERLREQIEEIHTGWQRRLEHCHTNYEEFDGEDHGVVNFYWNGSMGITVDASSLTQHGLDSLDDYKVLNRGAYSLKEALSDASFYPGDEINFSNYNGRANFYIDISDDDNGHGDPDDYDTFCSNIEDAWDNKYDEVYNVIMKWLLNNEFINPTPVREFASEYEFAEPQLQNFEVEFEDGDMEAAAAASIGPYDPGLWDLTHFKGHVEIQIRNIVSQELARIVQNIKNPVGYFPGFEPEVPEDFKEDYNLNNFALYLRRTGGNSQQLELKITFQADDVTTEEDMAEVTYLLKVVDRIFPRIVAEGERLLDSYYNQMRAQQRKMQMENPEDRLVYPTYEFNPNL